MTLPLVINLRGFASSLAIGIRDADPAMTFVSSETLSQLMLQSKGSQQYPQLALQRRLRRGKASRLYPYSSDVDLVRQRVGSNEARVQPDGGSPLADQPGVLSGGNRPVPTAMAAKEELPSFSLAATM
jgi:hypothetical protein